MNIIHGCVVDEARQRFFETGGSRIALAADSLLDELHGSADTLAVGVRSEDVRVAMEKSSATPIGLPVRWVEHYGSHSIIELALGDGMLRVRVPPDSPTAKADHAFVGFDIRRRNLLDTRTGRFLV